MNPLQDLKLPTLNQGTWTGPVNKTLADYTETACNELHVGVTSLAQSSTDIADPIDCDKKCGGDHNDDFLYKYILLWKLLQTKMEKNNTKIVNIILLSCEFILLDFTGLV